MMKYCTIAAAVLLPSSIQAFTSSELRIRANPTKHALMEQNSNPRTKSTALYMGYNKYGNGRSSSRYAAGDRSKRQERVGHVVRSEIASILHNGSLIKYDDDPIEDELRRRINIINADVSPDLRQARVTVSIMAGKDDIVSKRRAYAWLVRCTKSIRHALAQKMKHMKASPDITFVQVDVGAAVDVMQLIEKVSQGYKREDQSFELEYDDEDDDEWVDEFEDGEEGVREEEDDDDWIDFDGVEGAIGIEVDMNE
jgi:ribosome-binding factor A